MPGRIEFSLGPGPGRGRRSDAGSGGRPGARRLLLIGDFSGRPSAEREPLAERRTRRIDDRDALDAAMDALAPGFTAEDGERVDFASIDDFHPNALFTRLERFRALRSQRNTPPKDGASLLGGLLGAAPATPAVAPAPGAGAAPAASINAFVARLAASVSAPAAGPGPAERRAWQAQVDGEITRSMRALLQASAFQSLEAAWRGADWLLGGLELDETLQVHLFDATRDELLADVATHADRLAECGLHRALADRWRNVPGGVGWNVLAGLFTFDASEGDVGLLAALGLLAREAGGPFVAQADAALLDAAVTAGGRGEPGGPAGPGEAWAALRASEAAPWIALAAPAPLLRLPYGARTDPVAAFAFDEAPGGAADAARLPRLPAALAVLRVLAGPEGAGRTLGDLPAWATGEDGDRELQPCGGRWLNEAAWMAASAAGLVPIVSHRDRAAVSLPRVATLAGGDLVLAGSR